MLNETQWNQCGAIKKAVAAAGAEFHLCLGTVPPEAVANPAAVVASAVTLARARGLSGFNIDDESHTAPRGTVAAFTAWVGFVNAFADGLHAAGLMLTADVQSVTLPWDYKPAKALSALLSSSSIDRWINMDTYYFSTGRFMDALDYYSTAITPAKKAGVGMMNRGDISDDGYVARFHAIEQSGVAELDMFIMPISDAFFPWLWKFKTGCAGCANAGALSCWSEEACH